MLSLCRINCTFYRYLLFLGGLLLFFGCEEIIESPFEIIESKLVLASTFAPNQPVEVQITATQPVTGELQLTEVRDARVVLFEGMNLLAEFEYVAGEDGRPGHYSTLDFHPEINHHYTIHASVDGYTPISADSRIPTRIDILSLKVEDITRTRLMESEVYDYLLSVDYADPVEADDYYDLRISQEVIPFRVSESGDTTFYEKVVKSVQAPGANLGHNGAVGGQASVLLKDKQTENGVSMRLQSVIDPSREILGSIVVELRTVSEPYFLFQLNRQQEGNLSTGLIEPRVNSYTNINSGYGVFAGYSTSRQTYTLGAR